jgi:lysophospholipase L1-like esterase
MNHKRFLAFTALAAWSAAFVWANAEDRPVRVACIGDSITFAASSGDRSKTPYPAQLQELLGAGFEVKNFGVSGATMLKSGNLPYWGLSAFEDAKAFEPDVVVIKLGTNDSKPNNWNAEAYERDYREMVGTLQALPSHPTVLLCRPVPAFSDAFGISNEVIVNEIVPIVGRIAADENLTVIDAYNALLDHGDTFPDGIHPNERGCRVVAETVAEAVRNVAKVRHE